MHEANLDINGVRTSVITYGRWVEESPKSTDPKDIILVIPGNPGVTGFYKMFLHILHEKTGLPVWIVGHAGHQIPKNNDVMPIPKLKGNEKLYGLQGQIEHKLKFIEEYVPPDAKLHLVGHSIGSYIILELLKHKPVESRVSSVNLFFPAIEHLADTDNGKFLIRFIKPIVWLILFLSLIYTILPSVIRHFLTYWFMRIVGWPKMHLKTVKLFVHPLILEKVFFLAYEEMDQVKHRNDEIIKRHIDKIRFFYGAKDSWAPKEYCDKLIRDIPGVKAETVNFEHTFVLKQSREVGALAVNALSDNIK